MRLKGRILITPRSSSPGERKEGYAFINALTEDWNVNGRPKMETHVPIVLDKGSHQYEALRELFLTRARSVAPGLVKWSEVVEAVYSEAEIGQCEILALHINGEAGLGGNAYAQVYELESCPSCGLIKIQKQLGDPVIDLRKARKDFASTLNFSERIVSSRLKSLLEKAKIAGVEFKTVRPAHPSRSVRRQYFQLLVHNVLSPLLGPEKTYAKRCAVCGNEHDGTSLRPEKPDPWTEIHYWLSGPWSEMHFPWSSYRGWDLMRTEELFGGPTNPSDPAPRFPRLLASQRLFRLLRRDKISGFWVEPAHLDPVSH